MANLGAADTTAALPRAGRKLPAALRPQLGFQASVVRLKLAVAGFEIQDARHPGQVDALVDQLRDPAEPLQIVIAVAAGAALGARRRQQTAALIQPQSLRVP